MRDPSTLAPFAASTTDSLDWETPLPALVHEDDRVAALRSFHVMDTPPNPIFDIICDLAAKALNCPHAAISFIDQDRQWFKASIGMAVTELPRRAALCAHTIRANACVVVPDTSLDKRFAQNPLVRAGSVRFYAAAPICTPCGLVVGTVCGFDERPHDDATDDCDIAAVAQLAAAVLMNLDSHYPSSCGEAYDDPWSVSEPAVSATAWTKEGDAFLRHVTQLSSPSSVSDEELLACGEWKAAVDDVLRLDALESYGIMDTPPEDFFAQLCDAASEAFQCPIAAISFVDDERQWFKASVGLGLSQVPRHHSLAAALSTTSTVVLDTLDDPSLAQNPFVNGNPRVRFYASAPLTTPSGHVIGSVFVLDTQPRTACNAAPLADIARCIMKHLEMRKAAAETKDAVASKASKCPF
ncbi:Aste57867_24385 [Aphanomyces stellatus]|uniref:Aste57867_24385 protein n=1 Tax=Aphanomyces stellatus TaxID=120398 RepID=A0A485LRV5_9STRA|nr:hypothetical protein As57867_024309 [Aphanomyces stellatus]VFU01025.1 Aste57867_24385 [Aphanomyces stellatus]